MADNDHPFVLYDGTILLHLMRRKKNYRPVLHGGHQAFEGLQHPELIQALLQGKPAILDSLLRKLTVPLPPQDALVLCLCALDGSEKRMHAILDHAPPIREFQFLGVGKTASLLNVAVHFKKHKMLELFLKRGADPNGGPTPQTAVSPLEIAFCSDSYLCLERLLKSPDLRPELTDKMLKHWADLKPDPTNPYPQGLMCCQSLLEALTGEIPDPDDPFPCPPQLTLETLLEQRNLPFATHICRKRPLSDREQEAALQFLSAKRYVVLLNEHLLSNPVPDFLGDTHREYVAFLLSVLERYPLWLHLPELRFPIVTTALAPHKPSEALQSLVEQLEDGPVFLKELSASGGIYEGGLPVPKLRPNFTLSESLFPRWDERLGSRFVPTMEISADLYLPFMTDEEIQLMLDRIHFVGQRSADSLSNIGKQFLRYAPEHMLAGLLQPGGLLTLEDPRPLMEACLSLPPARRNQLLPYLHKETDYEL